MAASKSRSQWRRSGSGRAVSGGISPKDETGVMTTEPETVGHGYVHLRRPRLVGNVVQVTRRVRMLVVDGGRSMSSSSA